MSHYSEFLEDLIEQCKNEIETNDHMVWSDVVEEVVEDAVNRATHTDRVGFLDHTEPHDEWEVFCRNKTDFKEVTRAMAFIALREDVREHLVATGFVDD